ncbi:MAG TPA: GNAT family N-acetyltransferase [Candidatus Acidoferrales bacterium]|nr:GNAT family N-acetyltransferase [Candidatus Acidoferrales bacterium]
MTLEWLTAWWRSYGSGRELVSLLFFTPEDELVGAAPLYLDTRNVALGRKLTLLRLVGDGSGDSDDLDFPIRPGYEAACAEKFLSWLRAYKWDLCVLATLDENSRFRKCLLRSLGSAGWPFLETRSPHLFISFPESWECYLKRLAPEFRPLLGRYPRRLRSKHQIQIFRSTTQDLEKNLLKLFSLHKQRWNARGGSGAFSNPGRCQFYREMAHNFSGRGWLEFWLMDLDGTTVAAQFCFRFRDTVYLLQEGFDPKYANEKIGYALRAATLEHFIREGVGKYDFLAGADSYKLRFGAEESTYRNIEFAKASTRGSAYLALDRFGHNARQRARTHLPQPLMHFLRRTLGKANGARNLFLRH